jgi:hypothetical protein
MRSRRASHGSARPLNCGVRRHMTIEEAVRAFSRLPADGQAEFLARFGHNLTIAARDTYDFQAPTVRSPERLRAINEIQHRVLSHILALLVNGEWRYPDDALVSIMLEHDDEHLRRQAAWAFEDAMKKADVVPAA